MPPAASVIVLSKYRESSEAMFSWPVVDLLFEAAITEYVGGNDVIEESWSTYGQFRRNGRSHRRPLQ